MDWKTLQEEHRIWLSTEYPYQPPWMPAVGCLEEAGELLHVVLKMSQIQAFGPEERYKEKDWRKEMDDAVGDCAVYMCSLCNTCGWDFEELVSDSPSMNLHLQTVLGLCASLVRAAADLAEKQWRCYAVVYISVLRTVADAHGVNFEKAVFSTWAEVKGRIKSK